jgi:hypothetical protein
MNRIIGQVSCDVMVTDGIRYRLFNPSLKPKAYANLIWPKSPAKTFVNKKAKGRAAGKTKENSIKTPPPGESLRPRPEGERFMAGRPELVSDLYSSVDA